MVGSVGSGGFWPSSNAVGGHKALPFDQVDTDKNGSISFEEFETAATNLPGPADSAGTSSTADLFKQIDTDGDGAISKDEATAFRSKLSAQIQALMLQLQELNGTVGTTTADAGVASPSADAIFAKLDADGNGSISKDEFTAAFTNRHHSDGAGDRAAKLFDKIDTNGDGSISKDESQAYLNQAHGRHHHRHAWLSRLASQSYADASTAPSNSADTSTTTTTESQTV
jgi:Ca2+-binding EF-hand superfamily protein